MMDGADVARSVPSSAHTVAYPRPSAGGSKPGATGNPRWKATGAAAEHSTDPDRNQSWSPTRTGVGPARPGTSVTCGSAPSPVCGALVDDVGLASAPLCSGGE